MEESEERTLQEFSELQEKVLMQADIYQRVRIGCDIV